MSDIAIRVEGLSKRYRLVAGAGRSRYKTLQEDLLALPRRLAGRQRPKEEFWALRDISFEVKQGEVLGIIGRNGAGKSTLLKILSRITEPTRGQAEIYGRVGSLLEVGTGFHSELTGRENIYLSGAVLGMTRQEVRRKFDEIVAFAGVEQFLDTPAKHYSSGMYMRLAFAVAAHLEPEILLIDEVLAVGDAEFQKKCLGKMSEVAKAGRTVLFVSHNMSAVEALCHTALLLDKGGIVMADDHVRSVVDRYSAQPQLNGGVSSEWINPGNEFPNPWFKPMRFVFCDHTGRPQQGVSNNNADMWLQIEAEITAIDAALTVGYALYDSNGTLLYWSYQTDQPEPRWPRLAPGRHVLRSQLPARFLNEGAYRAELIGGLHFREWLFQPGAYVPTVSFSIQGGLSDSPYWMAKRPGLMAPVISWESCIPGQHVSA